MNKLKLVAGIAVVVIVFVLFTMTNSQGNKNIEDVLSKQNIELNDYSESLETDASVPEIEEVKQEVLSLSEPESIKVITLLKLSITQQEKMIEDEKEELGRIPTSDYCRKLIAAEKTFSLQENKLELLELLKEKIDEYNNENPEQEIEFDSEAVDEEREITEKQKNAVELLDSLC